MKNFLMLLAVVTAVWCASCSKDDDEPLNVEEGEGVITMVVNVKGNLGNDDGFVFGIYSFKKSEIITVDWGDGSVEEFRTESDDNGDDEDEGYSTGYLEGHSYAKRKSYTITIKGNVWGVDYEGNDIAPLTSLNVSRCPELKYLCCPYNNLTSLDVSKNTALEHLHCFENNLTSLDVGKNTALEILGCSDNNLTSLDVSNTALIELDCENNKFSASALNKIFTDLPQGKTWGDSEDEQSNILIENNPGTKTCDKSIAEKKGWRVYDNR